MRFLLDVNVLVALAFPSHPFHKPAHSWFHREPGRPWATCALTQAGYLRVVSRTLANTRDAVRQALDGLERDCRSLNHEYWPVDVDLRDLSDAQRARLSGPDGIADIQLLLLAHRYQGQLATFDKGIKAIAAGTKYEDSLLLL